jgi:hypothetical protein
MEKLNFDRPFDNWVNSSRFKATGEKYGIVPLSNIPSAMRRSSSDAHEFSNNSLNFLAEKMGSRLPYLPIHTTEEVTAFRRNYRKFTNVTGQVNFERFTEHWNTHVADGNTIFYKLESHLRLHASAVLKNLNSAATKSASSAALARVRRTLAACVVAQPPSGGNDIPIPPSHSPQLRPGTSTSTPLLPPSTLALPAVYHKMQSESRRTSRTCRVCFNQISCKGRGKRSSCQLVTVGVLTAKEAEASKTSDGQEIVKERIQQAILSGSFTADDLKLGTIIGKCKPKRSIN